MQHISPPKWLIELAQSAYKSSAADSLLAERGRIDSSHRMTDDILEYVNVPLIDHQTKVHWMIDKHMKLVPNFQGNASRFQVSTSEWFKW